VVGPEFVFMGLIDMLQEWTVDKKMERMAKIVLKRKDGDGISAIEPDAYKKRFQQKVRAIFEVEGVGEDIDYNPEPAPQPGLHSISNV
jgi:1-phosphatidylinositol-4-phosphate 5-kinase